MAPSNGGTRGPGTASSTSYRLNIVPVIPLSLVKPRSAVPPPAPPTSESPLPAAATEKLAPAPIVRHSPAPIPQNSAAETTITTEASIDAAGAEIQPSRSGGETDASTVSARPEVRAEPASGDALSTEGTNAPENVGGVREEETTATTAASEPHHSFVHLNREFPDRQLEVEMPAANNLNGHFAEAAHPAFAARRAHVHQPQASNGSLVMFGAFHDSNTTSPAPLSGGGTYGPSTMPYRPPEAVHPIHPDALARPVLASPTAEGYPPTPAYRSSSTPHSFHGSQASFPGEENGHAAFPHMNGHANYMTPRPMPPTPYSASMDPRLASVMPVSGGADPLDTKTHEEAVFNLQRAFADAEFADCLFEVRLPISPAEGAGDRGESRDAQPTLRVPAHRVVLARSPTLKRRLHHAHGTPADGTLLMYSDDRFLRVDAMYYTVRTLYGSPLGPVLPSYLQVRTTKEHFDLALGYAAAGRFLQLDLVLYKGVRAAARLVTWETVERAFEYALPGYICPYTSTPADSSPARPRTPDVWATAVRELLNSAIAFVIHNFPRDFVLDIDPGTPAFGRLPSAFHTAPSPNMPTIARGTSIPSRSSSAAHSRQTSVSTSSIPQMPSNPNARPSRNPTLAGIKFGDLSPQGANGSGDAPPPRVRPTAADSLFSRILLHLPFAILKEILEDNALASLSGGVDAPTRHRVMLDIVQEREARRVRAVEGLRRQTGPLYHFYKSRVSGFEAQPVDGDSDYKANNMSLKEEVTQATPEGPCLAQSWQRYEFSGAG